MPPKKANSSAPARKQATRATAKNTTKSASSATKNRKRKSPPSESEPGPLPPIPEWDKNVTTRYQREKKRFKIGWLSLSDETINEDHVDSLAKNLKGGSQNTWGQHQDKPIEGKRRPASKAVFRPDMMRRGQPSEFEQNELRYALMMENIRPKAREAIPNDPRFVRCSS